MTASDEPVSASSLLDALPYGIVAVDCHGTVVATSAAARDLLPTLDAEAARRCQDLFQCRVPGGPCEDGCLAERAARSTEPLPEIRIDTPGDSGLGAVWVTSAPLRSPPGAILHLRPGHPGDRRRRSEPHWISGPELSIRALGRTRVTSRDESLGGEWLSQRPGQVLKYLLCARRGVAMADEIADTIWPNSGQMALGNTRHVIHRLRDTLEPERRAHAESSFVISKSGGYALDRNRVEVDVDEFEYSVDEGLAAFERLDQTAAAHHLQRAVDLYEGEFLADEPYAEWAYEERSRLSGMAEQALRLLIAMAMEHDDVPAAIEHLGRLCELDPFDSEVHRQLITTLLMVGRRSEAKRRYIIFSRRILQEFGEDPEFELKSLIKERSRPTDRTDGPADALNGG